MFKQGGLEGLPVDYQKQSTTSAASSYQTELQKSAAREAAASDQAGPVKAQRGLPVFDKAALEGVPTDYQKQSSRDFASYQSELERTAAEEGTAKQPQPVVQYGKVADSKPAEKSKPIEKKPFFSGEAEARKVQAAGA